jgi:hypothetical protein
MFNSACAAYAATMRVQGLIAVGLMLAATAAGADPAGPHLVRDDRGKVAGVEGVGAPCDLADAQCSPYTSTGTVTKVDRERDGTLASFALQLPSGNVELQNFDEAHEGLSRNDKRDLGKWLRPGMKVTVSGTGSSAPGSTVVDKVIETD